MVAKKYFGFNKNDKNSLKRAKILAINFRLTALKS